jgi:hypothetical protein
LLLIEERLEEWADLIFVQPFVPMLAEAFSGSLRRKSDYRFYFGHLLSGHACLVELDSSSLYVISQRSDSIERGLELVRSFDCHVFITGGLIIVGWVHRVEALDKHDVLRIKYLFLHCETVERFLQLRQGLDSYSHSVILNQLLVVVNLIGLV